MNSQDFYKHFAIFADAPDGIAKIRELILQLAVQGKLVLQDKNDEPARKLLERAHAKAASRLGTTRKLLTKKASLPNGLPECPCGWTWTTLSELGVVSPRNELPDETEVSFLPMSSIPAKYNGPLEPELRIWRDVKKGFTHVADDDVVMAKITPCFQNGKTTVIRGLTNGYGAGTTELHVLRPYPDCLMPQYAVIFLKSPHFVKQGVARMSGSAGQQRVPKEHFAQSPFPLPPLAEQRRIVERVNYLLELCNELTAKLAARRDLRSVLVGATLDRLVSSRSAAEFPKHARRLCDSFDLLFDIPTTIPQLRLAILQLGVQGQLVQRSPANVPVVVPERKSSSGVFVIPPHWQWVTVGQVADTRLGKMLDKAKNKGKPMRYLRNTNVHWFRFDLTSVKTMLFADEEMDEFEVRPGDVLICEGGHGIGRTAVWTGGSERMMFQKALHRVRPSRKLDSNFFAYCMRVYDAIGVLQKHYTGAGIPHLTGKALSRVAFPLPPLDEQREIVRKVTSLLAECDALDAALVKAEAASIELSSSLIRSLLKDATAFGGVANAYYSAAAAK